jgi:hypothetical protein
VWQRFVQFGAGDSIKWIDLDKTTFDSVGVKRPHRRGFSGDGTAGVTPRVEKGEISATVTSLDINERVDLTTIAIVEELVQVSPIGGHGMS